MPDSTRVARLGSGNVEIHLRKRLAITSEITQQVAQLPSQDPWVLLTYNTATGDWLNARTFDSFTAADEAFVTRAQAQGISAADRLEVDGPPGSGRVVESG